jgi:hypothetical protein
MQHQVQLMQRINPPQFNSGKNAQMLQVDPCQRWRVHQHTLLVKANEKTVKQRIQIDAEQTTCSKPLSLPVFSMRVRCIGFIPESQMN